MNRSRPDECECLRTHAAATGRRRFLRAGTRGLAALATLSLGQRADAARGDSMRILCSGPAGSIPDLIARTVADQLLVTLGLRALVDNRPGAAGQISVGALKSAAADGSTLLLAQGAIATVYPYLYPKLAYDAVSDLAPVSLAGEMTLALAVGPAVPASVANVRDLVAWMRGHPELANVGSPGTGTLPHLLEAMLMREAGAPWQHIVYSGGPPAVVALLGGQIAALVLPEGLFSPHRAAGRLRVLATSGAQRTVLSPDVPTLVEQGFSDLVVREWFAFFMSGRAGPPRSRSKPGRRKCAWRWRSRHWRLTSAAPAWSLRPARPPRWCLASPRSGGFGLRSSRRSGCGSNDGWVAPQHGRPSRRLDLFSRPFSGTLMNIELDAVGLADILLTGDEDLWVLTSRFSRPIVTAHDFLGRFMSPAAK